MEINIDIPKIDIDIPEIIIDIPNFDFCFEAIFIALTKTEIVQKQVSDIGHLYNKSNNCLICQSVRCL